MKYNTFERHIHKTLSQHRSTLDHNALLEQLGLPAEQKSKKGFWWLSSMLLVGMIALGGYYFLKIQSDQEKTSNNATALRSDKAQEHSVVGHQDPNNALQLSNTNMSADHDEVHESSSPKPQNESQKFPILLQNQNLTANSISPSAPAKKQLETNLLPSSSIEYNKENTANNSSFFDDISKANATTNQRLRDLEIVASIENSSLVTLTSTAPTILIEGPRDPIECPTFSNKGKMRFSLIPEVGLAYPSKSLTFDGEPTTTQALRMQEEQSLEAISAALYAKVGHSKWPFYIKTGLHLSRIAERLPLTYNYTEQDTTQGIISLTVSPTGDTVTAIYGDIITERMIMGNTTRHYYLTQWDIPLALGWERTMGSWTVGVEGGVHINVSNRISGNILQDPNTFRPVMNTDVKRSLGLGYFGGIHVGYPVGPFGNIYMAARVRHVPTVANPQTATQQSYMLYGLHAGYEFRF